MRCIRHIHDETIVMDVDYLISGDSLNACWGHKNDIMLHRDVQDIQFARS